MVALLTRDLDLLEQTFLERLGPELDRTENDRRSRLSLHCGAGGELLRIVGHEVAAVPVRLEDAGDLVDHVGVARP